MTIPNPEFVVTEEHEYDLLQSEMETGPIKRALRRPDRIRRFHLLWNLATRAERDQLVTEFRAAKGACGTTTFTPTDEVTPVTVRFVEDSLRWSWSQPGRVSMEVLLEQELY